MLLWFRRRPGPPEHVASVELVRPEGRSEPFYLAWCDCGWHGDDQRAEASARAEAREHTPHVRNGLRPWGA